MTDIINALREHPISGAVFNADHTHRFALWRIWKHGGDLVQFIGLNPSRADAVRNDPTITRCVNFAKEWGYGGMFFTNLFSIRSPEPQIVKNAIAAPTATLRALTPETDAWLQAIANLDDIRTVHKIICCWGSWDFIAERAAAVIKMLPQDKLWCFGKNQAVKDKSGIRIRHPKHPLYLKGDTCLMPMGVNPFNAKKKIGDLFDFNEYASGIFERYLQTFTEENKLIMKAAPDDDMCREEVEFLYTTRGARLAERMKDRLHRVGEAHFPHDWNDIEIETHLYQEV